MSFCGFDRYGNRTARRAGPLWAASRSDSEILDRVGQFADVSSAFSRTDEERRASIDAVLGQVAKCLGRSADGVSTASKAVLDTLRTDTQGESALAKYLANYK